MKEYCGICDQLNEIQVRPSPETYDVRGEKISVDASVAFCGVCGNKVNCPSLDEQTLHSAFAVYREKHNLLTPSCISRIRNKYFLSQRALAKLLEWGEITIYRYENGAIQDPAHNEVLMLIEDPQNMLKIFKKNGHLLSQHTQTKLQNRLDELLGIRNQEEFSNLLETYLSNKNDLNEYTGFTKFDLDRMKNMVIYIVSKTKGVFITKLNKLLWYTDFLFFKDYSKSISGCNYIHHHYGPVPDDYELIISSIIKDGTLVPEEVYFPNGSGGLMYKTANEANVCLFASNELQVMDFVVDHFSKLNCSEIKDLSHQEKGYQETDFLEKISYKFAKFIEVDLK